jgi:hypothetical protein
MHDEHAAQLWCIPGTLEQRIDCCRDLALAQRDWLPTLIRPAARRPDGGSDE